MRYEQILWGLEERGYLGPCAKATVKCRIISADGEEFVGENYCMNPQKVCPRESGEGYDKCESICNQTGHAEDIALRLAEGKTQGAHATLMGHTYFCMDCQHKLFAAGVKTLSVEME